MIDYPDVETTSTDIIAEPNQFKLEDFELYKTARNLRKKIYQIVNELPDSEQFGLVPQMRRAAISISNNIAEGHGRWHYREAIHFCRIARGSVEEVIDDLNICIDENYFNSDQCEVLKEEAYQFVKQINGYMAYLKKQMQIS